MAITYESFVVIVAYGEPHHPHEQDIRKKEGPMTLDEALQRASSYDDPSGYSKAVVELHVIKPKRTKG